MTGVSLDCIYPANIKLVLGLRISVTKIGERSNLAHSIAYIYIKPN